MSTELSPLN